MRNLTGEKKEEFIKKHGREPLLNFAPNECTLFSRHRLAKARKKIKKVPVNFGPLDS